MSEYKRINGTNLTDVRYVRDNAGKAISMLQYPEPGTPNPVPTTYYFVYNGHGDVTALTDSTGTVVATYSYDEFGNITSETGTVYNPLRYSGAHNAYYDSETALYKMGTRYYQPDIGRWLTRDGYNGDQQEPLTQNKYAYVENNPVNKTDATGNWSSSAHGYQTRTIAAYKVHIPLAISEKLSERVSMVDWTYEPATRPSVHFNTWSKNANAHKSIRPWRYTKYVDNDVRINNVAKELKLGIDHYKNGNTNLCKSNWASTSSFTGCICSYGIHKISA